MNTEGPTSDPVRRDDQAVRDSYEEVPYPSSAHYHTHPNLLAVLALLHGQEPPAVESCRVLELGCADGGNLLPMAFQLPESRFVGIDISARGIATGREMIERLGVENVELLERSLLDVDADFGRFDFVIAHGLLSWVPPRVAEKVLEICARNLAENGVAYVSYNALPGWHLMHLVRDMMLFHSRGVEEPLERAERSVELVSFMAESLAGIRSPHALIYDWAKEHLAIFRDQPSYLVHDLLEKHNTPFYFRDLMSRAEGHGLQYLADADRQHMGDNLPPWTLEKLASFSGSRTELEQYFDFVTNRPFRRTLLCHRGDPRERRVSAAVMRRLRAASVAQPLPPEPGAKPEEGQRFAGRDGRVFSVGHPLAQAVLLCLGERWPRTMTFDPLMAAALERLGISDPPADEHFETLAAVLAQFFFSGVLELFLLDPGCADGRDQTPEASPLARRQAALGPVVTNRLHQAIQLEDELTRRLVLHLDGHHQRPALVEAMAKEVAEHDLPIHRDGEPVANRDRRIELLPEVIEEKLKFLAYSALLVE